MSKAVGFVKKRWYVVLILIVVVVVFLMQRTNSTSQQLKSTTYTVKKQTLTNTLSVSGSIDADEHVVLQFQTPGLLTWVGVKEGDTVKKYQGIASLDQRSVTKVLQQTLNTYAKTRNAFDQSTRDNQRIGDQSNADVGDTMKRLLENAQYDLNSSVLAVEIQDLARQYSYLTTPIEGVVIRIDTPYAGVNTGITSGFEIVNPKTIFFDASVDQTDVVNLKNGMVGKITLDAFPEQDFNGKIRYIAYTPKAGESGTVYEVKMAIDPVNEQAMYRLGMTGDAEFILDEKNNATVIPGSYLKSEGNKKYTYVIKNGKKQKVYVKTGLEVDSDYEVLSGVEEGDVVTNIL